MEETQVMKKARMAKIGDRKEKKMSIKREREEDTEQKHRSRGKQRE